MADAVYLVRDLLFVSKIDEAAEHFGIPAERARDADALVAGARGARLVIVDLGHADAAGVGCRVTPRPPTSSRSAVGHAGSTRWRRPGARVQARPGRGSSSRSCRGCSVAEGLDMG
jgi:hypothetical protein